MPQSKDSDQSDVGTALRGRLLLIAFSLSMLMFLVAIDRPQWFHIRPASGTAAAMSHATGH